MRPVLCSLLALAVCLATAPAASARPKRKAPPPAEPAPAAPAPADSKAVVVKDRDGQKVMRFSDGVVIEGKIHKPNTFYVLQRSTINYDWETMREGFLPKILDSVKRPPF